AFFSACREPGGSLVRLTTQDVNDIQQKEERPYVPQDPDCRRRRCHHHGGVRPGHRFRQVRQVLGWPVLGLWFRLRGRRPAGLWRQLRPLLREPLRRGLQGLRLLTIRLSLHSEDKKPRSRWARPGPVLPRGGISPQAAFRKDGARSKRSRFITLFHAATKSFTNFSFESAQA